MGASETWTAPADWTAEQLVDEVNLNEQLRDNLTYLKARGSVIKRVRAVSSGTQSIPDDAITALTYYTSPDAWDTDAMHSTAANPERLSCKVAGTYLVEGELNWATGNDDRVMRLGFYVNGTASNIARVTSPVNSTLGTIMHLTTVYPLTTADYVLSAAYQKADTATGAFDVVGGWFAMTRLGD